MYPLQIGQMGFHPFLMSAAAAAGLPPNAHTYMASFLNSPLRQLVNVDNSEELLTKRAAELMNGMGPFDPTQALQQLHHHHQQQHQRDSHRQRSSLSSSNRSQISRSPSPNSCDESMSSSKPHDDVIMNGKDVRMEHDDDDEEEERALALGSTAARRLVVTDDEEIGEEDIAKDMSKSTSVINSPSRGDGREQRKNPRLGVCGDDDDVSDNDEDSEEKDKMDNNVQRILNTVNASVTRELLKQCSLKNGYSVEKMLGSGGESSCDPMMSPGSEDESQNSRPNSRFGDDYDMDEDRSQDPDSEIHNNNNSIISNGTAEELIKLNSSVGGSHNKKGKNGGVEGLAARLELCQNDPAVAAAFGSKAAASLLLQIQQHQQLQQHDRDDKVKEMDLRRIKEESDMQQRRHDDENPSSQSENELGDHRKFFPVILLCCFVCYGETLPSTVRI